MSRKIAYIELYDSWKFEVIKQIFNALPDDCRFRGGSQDLNRHSYILYLEHEDFPECPEGNSLPRLMLFWNNDLGIRFKLGDEPFEFTVNKIIKPPLCTCGSWKSGGSGHTNWCDVK